VVLSAATPPPTATMPPDISHYIAENQRLYAAMADISVCRFPPCLLLMHTSRLPLDPVNSIAGFMGITIPMTVAIAT
jgi:uncharacterized membrane protein YdjX (TVP38/TMEM64 family)